MVLGARGPSGGSLNEDRGGGGGGGGGRSYREWTVRERHSLQLVRTENKRWRGGLKETGGKTEEFRQRCRTGQSEKTNVFLRITACKPILVTQNKMTLK